MFSPTAVNPSKGRYNVDVNHRVVMNHYDGGMDMSCPSSSCDNYVAKTGYIPFQVIGNN